jgi:hypothetical protein
MANRVLIGKGTSQRGGTDKFGMWVSRPGKNVLTCSDDELIMDTDKGGSSDIKGFLQAQSVSVTSGVANATGTTGSISSGATATVSFLNFNWSFGIIPIFGATYTTSGTGSSTEVSGASWTINSFTTSGVNITNNSAQAETLSFSVIPKFSNVARF